MLHANVEREAKIRELWQASHTIDEMTLLTDIPRSSIGYYVRKFNKENRRRPRQADTVSDRMVAPPTPRGINEIRESLWPKRLFWEDSFPKLMRLMSDGKYEELHHLLQCLQLLPGVMKTFQVTQDEAGEYSKELMAESEVKVIAKGLGNLSKESSGEGEYGKQLKNQLEAQANLQLWDIVIKETIGKGYPEVLQEVLKVMLKLQNDASSGGSSSGESQSKGSK
jgi:hypothetical protein